MDTDTLASFIVRLLSFAKATFNSGERPVLSTTTLGITRLNAFEK